MRYLYLMVDGFGKVIDTYVDLKSAKRELFVGHKLYRRRLDHPLEPVKARGVRGFMGGRP